MMGYQNAELDAPIDRQDFVAMSSLFYETFNQKAERQGRQEMEAQINALEVLINSLNAFLGNRLVKDKPQRLNLIKFIVKLTQKKEALQWALMSEEDRQLLRETAERFGRKAASSVGGTRILEREK